MASSEPKTKLTTASVTDFLNKVEPADRRADCFTLMKIMEKITGEPARMWGPSIVGFGTYHYVYASGKEGDWPRAGFSPRKQNLTIYLMSGFSEYNELIAKLGKCSTSKACLYIKSLKDIKLDILSELIQKSEQVMNQKYPKK